MDELDHEPTNRSRSTTSGFSLLNKAMGAGPGIIWLCVALVVTAGFMVVFGRSFIIDTLFGMGGIRRMEAQLRTPEVYTPAALRLATYCQSDQKLFPQYLSSVWLPVELQHVGGGYASIRTNGAYVEFGGGFYHFGYQLELKEAASGSVTNVWELSQFAEGSQSNRLLVRVEIPKAQHVGADELQKLVLGGFDDSLKSGNLDAFRSKVLFQLRFRNERDAVRTCNDWIARQPDNWLPRFTCAHVRCRVGEYDAAAADFTAWTQAHKNFPHCIYLALFQLREGRTNDALQAVRWALEQPFAEPRGTDGSKFYLGQNGALIAFMNGDYNLCTAMCDKILSDPGREDWWRPKVLRTKAAAIFLRGQQGPALDFLREAESHKVHDSFMEPDMAKADSALRDAIASNDISAVKDVHSSLWAEDSDKWFSPFDLDETGIHGMKVPTPYPKSWKTDKIGSVEQGSPGQILDTSLVRKAPNISGYQYQTDAMVESINGLRRLGKDKALAVLRQYYDEVGDSGDPGQRKKLFLICRLLFVNPQGWKTPGLGHPEPEINWDLHEQFPLFPLALSGGVPFVLVSGYIAGGYTSDTPDKCIELCRGFSLITSDLPTTNHLDAAIDLVQSEKFKRLYSDTNDLPNVSEMVMRQVEPTSERMKELPPSK
jgi:hypothetical protein